VQTTIFAKPLRFYSVLAGIANVFSEIFLKLANFTDYWGIWWRVFHQTQDYAKLI
jgi:hypothetical protein